MYTPFLYLLLIEFDKLKDHKQFESLNPNTGFKPFLVMK